MKPRYRFKGKYADERRRIVIEYEEEGKIKIKFIPKPDKLLSALKGQIFIKEKCPKKTTELTEP